MQVYARSKTTDRVRLVPEHWLTHPVLSEKWEAVPDPGVPSEDWTIAQLRDYAGPAGIDLSGKTRHAEIYKAVSESVATSHNEGGASRAGSQ